MSGMRCISLWPPWAPAMMVKRLGSTRPLKERETRGWKPDPAMIGQRLAIACSKSPKPHDGEGKVVDLKAWWMANVKRVPEYSDAFARQGFNDFADMPFGEVICHGILASVDRTDDLLMRGEIDQTEFAWGNYAPGRFAWKLSDLVVLPVPVPVMGRQGIYWWEDKTA